MSDFNEPNSLSPSDRAELDAFRLLALRYLDGLHTDEEARELGDLLSSSPEFRDFFASLSVEAGMLHEMLLPATSDDGESTSLFDRAGALALGTECRQRAEVQNSRLISSKGTKFAIAAAVLMAAMGGWLLRTNWRGDPGPTIASDNTVPAIYNTRLDSGTTRFTLPNVGHVIAEGPAEFNLLGPMRARLNSGRIKMRVTKASGHGFVVETPYGEVTDLGTEFGLDVSEKGKAGLVVFEGEVDLRVADQQLPQSSAYTRVERLVGGDGVTFDGGGQLDRIMSIVTGKSATFRSGNQSHEEDADPLVAGISDNLRASDTMRFYEIVRGGFGEDARAYVDRTYEWNGVDANGLPSFLVGADYILPFNDDKHKRLKITLSLARPTTVYILFDDRGTPPNWLTDKFVRTGFKVGMDEDQGPPSSSRPSLKTDRGPAKSIDYTFSVWKQEVAAPGKIELGAREGPVGSRSMYGIVVAPLGVSK